jgi:hypothetical protein
MLQCFPATHRPFRVSVLSRDRGVINASGRMINERFLRRALILFALIALGAGLAASVLGQGAIANWIWVIGTVPVIVALCVSMVRDLLAGRMGVDAVAFAVACSSSAPREPSQLASVAFFNSLLTPMRGNPRLAERVMIVLCCCRYGI